MVILRQPWEGYSADDKDLLQRILTKIKQPPAAVRIISGPKFTLDELQKMKPSALLIFGADVEGVSPYQIVPAAQGFSAIRADDLPELDQERKKRLWVGLREMFGV